MQVYSSYLLHSIGTHHSLEKSEEIGWVASQVEGNWRDAGYQLGGIDLGNRDLCVLFCRLFVGAAGYFRLFSMNHVLHFQQRCEFDSADRTADISLLSSGAKLL